MQPWGVLPSLGSPATFPSSWIKASGFASHPFEWFAVTSYTYPQIICCKKNIFIRRLRRLTQIICCKKYLYPQIT